MILLHRLTSFAIAIATAVSFAWLIYAPESALGAVLILSALMALLLGRLLQWEVKTPSFWVFLGAPLFFFFSSLFFFLFLEDETVKWILAVGVTLGMWLYMENLFTFYYLPAAYQAYALEYLSLVLYVASGFFFASGAYGAQLFLQLPLWIPALMTFWVVLAATMGVFWVSKVGTETSTLFAFAGAVLMTEVYMILAMLPTSFITNAAVFSVFLYLYLGLTRAHVLEKLSPPVLQRYLVLGGLLFACIFLTARWT